MTADWQFVEIPRTASTAIKAAIGQGSQGPVVRHLPASEYPNTDLLISCIRDPFDRLVSLWCYTNSSERGIDVAGFRQWVADGLPYNGATLEETPASSCITRKGCWIALPQVTWLDDRVQLFRYETLPWSLYRMCNQHGIPYRHLDRHGESTRLATDYYYDDQTRARTRQLYDADYYRWIKTTTS